MSDLIKRQDAIDALEEQLDYLNMLNKDENPTVESNWYGVNWARNTIADLPSVEQKRGEWIWSPKDIDGTVSGCCSNCSFSHLFIGGHTAQYNYCPNCGARMDERGEDGE